MHQEAFPGEDISDRPPPEESVPGLLAADRRRRAERALPRPRRSSEACGMSAPGVRAAAAAWRRTSRPRRAASRRDGVRLAGHEPAATARSSTRRFRDLPQFLAPGDLRRRQHVRDAAGRAARDARGRARARAPTLDAAPATGIRSASGSSSSAAGTRRSAASRSASSSSFPAAGRRRSSRRTPASGCGSPGSTCREPLERLPRSARAADPLRLRAAALAALGLPERLRARARQRRDGERRPAVHGRADHASSSPAASSSRRSSLHTGVSSQERHEPPVPRALSRARAHGAAGERRARVGRTRDRRRHDGRARARDGRPAGRDGRPPARAGRTSSSRPSAASGRSTACSAAFTRRSASHLDLLSAAAGDGAARAQLRRRRSSTATAGTSSATAT